MNRIKRAYDEGQKFRVIIFLPLEPAFSGEIRFTQSIKTILKYTYRTICRHDGKSLVEQLISHMGGRYIEYISFFSLRNHAILKGSPKQVMIYIHAKLLLVDDEKLIIGSANLNDRSMLGDRDSELAVLLEGGHMKKINGREVSSLVYDLRIKILSLYTGIKDDVTCLIDPISDGFWNLINQIAYKNTKLYRDIFKCIPDDIYTSFEDFKYSHNELCFQCLVVIREKYLKLKDMIQGFIVDFPLSYLKEENLDRGFSKEKVVSVDMFL